MNPNSSSLFFLIRPNFYDWPDSRFPPVLTIENLNDRIDLDSPLKTTALDCDTFYSVEMGSYGKYFLHITKEVPDLSKKDYFQRISFKFDALYCHLVTHSSRELCQLTIVKTQSQYESQKDDRRVSVSVGGVQLDDMNECAHFPVIFAGFPLNDRPFISLFYQQFSNEVVGFITAEVQPFTIKVDLSFVSDLIALFDALEIDRSIFASEKAIGNKRLIQLLRLMPISSDISFNGRTERKANCFYPDFSFPLYFSLIPTIDSLNVFFELFESTFLSVTGDELLAFVGEHYLYELKSQWLTIIGSAAFIGSPQKLVRNFGRSFKSLFSEHNGAKFMRETVGGIIETPETCLKTVSSSCRSLTDDYSPQNSDDTALGSLKWGARSFCLGLGRAVAGIVTRPIDKKNEGVGGILKGVGQGIAEVVTNTVGGVLDLGSGVLGGVRRGLFGEVVLHRVSQPIKHEASLPAIHSQSDFNSNENFYSLKSASFQCLSKSGTFNVDNEILYWDRNVQIYRTMVHTERGNLLISDIKLIEKNNALN